MTSYPEIIDLHMHTTVSDGTDTPAGILARVREKGIELFAVADHDDIKGCLEIRRILKSGDPKFLCGAEFSCRDEFGKYHILGYGYDPDAKAIRDLVATGHSYRMWKVTGRLEKLDREMGIRFPKEEIDALLALDNPGKPHIGNLMVKYGYASSKEQAIRDVIDKVRIASKYIRPEEAIEGILGAGGVPVLAHPSYGSGDQIVIGDEMDERLKRLTGFGLQGVEAFYSGFTPKLTGEMLRFAKKYDLYVTAGSDYHGNNKMVILGNTNLERVSDAPDALRRFLDRVEDRILSGDRL